MKKICLAHRYECERLLSHVGSRFVWKAQDRLLKRPVVAKGSTGSPTLVVDELKRLRACAYPRVVRAYELAHCKAENTSWRGPLTFFTQEWLSGPTLKELAGHLSVDQLMVLTRETLELLAFLHDRNLSRLDLKPHHLFRTDVGWKLIDLDQARPDRPLASAEAHGTLAYVAPECLGGDPGGVQSDLYSLGAILYEAMVGKPLPLLGDTLDEIRSWLESSPPELPETWKDRAPRLVELVLRLLSPRAANRPACAEDTLRVLDASFAWRRRCPLPNTSLHGRTEIVTTIRGHLDEAEKTRGGGLLLEAPAGGGCSAVLHALRDVIQEMDKPALLLDAPTWQIAGASPIVLLMKFLGMLADVAPQPEFFSSPPDGAPGELNERLVTETLKPLLDLATMARDRCGNSVTVLLDDFEQVDSLTTQVLERLSHYLPGSGLHLIVARPTEALNISPLKAFARISLPALDIEALRKIGEEIFGPAAFRSVNEVRALQSATGGLPGPFRTLMAARWQPSDAGERGSPAAERLSTSLPSNLANALRALSILSQPFSAKLGEEILNEAEVSTGLSDLVSCGLVLVAAIDDSGESWLRFLDGGSPSVLEKGLSTQLASRLHQRAAEVLEQRLVTHHADVADIARHLVLGGNSTRAIPYLHQAIAEARRSCRPDQVAQQLAVMTSVTSADDATFPELNRQLGEALTQLGRLPEARAAFEVALDRQALLPPERRIRCLGDLGDVLVSLGDFTNARHYLKLAVKGSRDISTSGDVRLRWLHLLAWLDLQVDDCSGSEEWLREGRSLVGGSTSANRIDAVYLRALLSMKQGTSNGQTEEQLREALETARTSGNVPAEVKLLNVLARMARRNGDVTVTGSYLEQLVERARASWDPAREAFATYNFGVFLQEQLESQRALEQFERAALLWERQGNEAQEAKARIECLALLIEYNKLDRADSMVTRLHTLQTQRPQAERVAGLALELFKCRIRLRRGRLEGLAETLEALDQACRSERHSHLGLEILADRMELALVEERPLETLRHFGEKPEGVEPSEAPLVWRRIHRLAIRAHERLLPSDSSSIGSEPRTDHIPVSASSIEHASAADQPRTTEPVHGLALDADESRVIADGRSRQTSQDIASTTEWLQAVQRLLEVADEAELLAAELAALAGNLFQGRGLVVLFEGTRLLAGRGYRLAVQEVDDVSSTILEQVRARREPFICPDVRANAQLGQLRSLRDAQVRSVLCCPVLVENACLGVIYIDHVEVGRVTAPQALEAVKQIAGLTSGLLETSLRRRQQGLGKRDEARFGLIGNSVEMQRLRHQLETLAASSSPDLTVLFLGETGTGKSTIARRLHAAGSRRSGPFVPVNAASIPETLFESLMYGFTRGAFTGAVASQPGWLETARGGSLFLDEVADMPMSNQSRLLETLGGARCFRRLGADQEQALDVHLFCATSRDLKEEVFAGRFRPELLRRIQVNTCRIPPLRERGQEDIHLLACHLITTYLGRQQLLPEDTPSISLEDYLSRPAREYLYQYGWPWNVGEMENLFRHEGLRTRLRTLGREKVELEDVFEALDLDRRNSWIEVRSASSSAPPLHLNYREVDRWCEEIKGEHMRRVHAECGGNVTETARRMRCSRDVVYKYLGVGSGK